MRRIDCAVIATTADKRAEAEAFWRFSLRVYARPGVAEALIGLQDRAGHNVNLVLFGLWLAVGRGRAGSTAAALTRARAAIAKIDRDVLLPLRNLRRALKGDADPAMSQTLRRRVLAHRNSPPSGACRRGWRRVSRGSGRRVADRAGACRRQSAADPGRRFRRARGRGAAAGDRGLCPRLSPRPGVLTPAAHGAAVEVKQVEQPAESVVDHLVDRPRLGVERRRQRGDDGAHLRERGHRAQMPGVERCLAHREHEPAALLQDDIRGAGEKGRRDPGRDFAHAADRARHDDHAERLERARRYRCRHVADRMCDIGARTQIGRLQIGLERKCHFGRAGDHQVRFDRQILEQRQEPRAIGDAGGTADADDQARIPF